MMKSLNKKYEHFEVENGKYDYWLEKRLFSADNINNKPVFSMILPPPNITGKLHLGHAWNNTLQDVMARYKVLTGYGVTWFPGMDHAGIATQVKVAERIWDEEKKRITSSSRDQFITKVNSWKDEYAKIIREQWAKLGLALDYRYEKFTLDSDVNQLVNETFVKLYNDGLIYRGKKIINWDPQLKTALSNMEVTYKEVQGKMYYLNYPLVDSDEMITIATTRPETMFADQALVFHPNDVRYQKYLHKEVINPVNKQRIPIIADEYIVMEFGTGIMKCTPAHDFNDYQIAKRHNLDLIICMDSGGIMNATALQYEGLDRFVCRQQLIGDLEKQNLVVKIVDFVHQVGYSERSDVIIEPYLSEQWFVKMQPLVNKALKLQNSADAILFYPSRFANILDQWLENIQDWCISRQLWWGHQLPVWYHQDTKEIIVAITPPNKEEWVQDSDVLDTWFSSALWPLIFAQQNNDKLFFKKYLPNSLLVTGYDIIFFWISRMIFESLYLVNKKPFKAVLIHGLIRDEQGRKMSKSLGNGIDPMDIITEYGADSLRFFLLTNSTPGQDLRFSITKVRSSWNFINKLWNASRYVLLNLADDFKPVNNILDLQLEAVDYWILNNFNFVLEKVQANMEKYEFVVSGKYLFNFVWDDFCSWYIELSKSNLQNPKTKMGSIQVLFYLLKQIIILLHPLIPFVTEEIYQKMFNNGKSIMEEKYPIVLENIAPVNYLVNVINITTVIRELRATRNIKHHIALNFNLNSDNQDYQKYAQEINGFLQKLTNSQMTTINEKISHLGQTIALPLIDGTIDVFLDMTINKKEQQLFIQKQLQDIHYELERSKTILNNEQFLNKAPIAKVNAEKHKYEQYEELYKQLQKKLQDILS
ncbi:valine--tRNA ligase [Spiroplasma endosymbiont of Eupeodes luniger]|uniref:valine--tRNA ligase n=1 Tax=Spiroplasma endosymbiont of Eupeodes luniger TaxID=3066300 RepID=UPI003BB04F72